MKTVEVLRRLEGERIQFCSVARGLDYVHGLRIEVTGWAHFDEQGFLGDSEDCYRGLPAKASAYGLEIRARPPEEYDEMLHDPDFAVDIRTDECAFLDEGGWLILTDDNNLELGTVGVWLPTPDCAYARLTPVADFLKWPALTPIPSDSCDTI